MINEILSKIKKYIPSYWPLQSFIATNPLFELVDIPLDECMYEISKYTNIIGSLGIEQYHEYYDNGKISLNSLDSATKEFLADKGVELNKSDSLSQILTDNKFQKNLEIIIKNNNYDDHNILVSNIVESSKDYVESQKTKVRVIKFVADFLDLGQAKWSMPFTNNSLYGAWQKYIKIENKHIKTANFELPSQSHEAIEVLLTKLSIPEEIREHYLLQIVFQILGWCSILKWLEERTDNPYINKQATVADVIAIWLSLELAIVIKYKLQKYQYVLSSNPNQFASVELHKIINNTEFLAILNPYSIRLIWQRALEINYQTELMGKITYNQNKVIKAYEAPNAQFVFCIDTRSEGIRRKLELVGNYQTFGFAGFFGVGFKLYDEDTSSCSFQCPAIVAPSVTLENKSQSKSWIKKIQDEFLTILNKVKNSYLAPLIFFDMAGAWFSLSLIGKTLFPEKFIKTFKNSPVNKCSDKSIDVFNPDSGFSPNSLAETANFVLNAIGLVSNFAPFVFISGHIAESENNPFQSSLDCGACGGNGGISNAIAFCQALNNSEVREILENKFKIAIPQNTFFVSSCHNTTLDKFIYYNMKAMNYKQLESFQSISLEIDKACELTRLERLTNLYGDNNVETRKANWAELIPEMALAGNAAFIIGPRALTRDLNLERRTFLHSYEPDLDPDGETLSFIFNAPVIVCHWINSQYYFSSTDPEIYGAGNKAIHNVVGQFGVMEGNFSDYKIGLPIQSVSFRDKLVYEPLRLLVVVYAKQSIVDKILADSPKVAAIFNGRWAHLQVIQPAA